MMDHLSTEQIASYRERRTQPEELLRVDDHISHCAECRQRLASAVDLRAALQSTLGEDGGAVPAEAIPRTHHLAYEQLEAYVDGKLSSADRNNAQAHLEICQICSEELRDLHAFKIELAAPERQTTHGWLARLSAPWLTRRRVALGLAMAAVIVLTVEVARWRLAPAPEVSSVRTPKTHPTAKETFAAINNLSPEEQSAVRDAISQQRINSPAVLAELHGKRQTLLGESHEAARFEVLRPLGEVVPEVRPVFRWQPLTGASSYSVAIFDTNLNPVQFSPPLRATQWTADRPLKRGRMYLWQVTARLRDGKSFSAPSPPNPEAKFRVLDQKKAGEFDRLQALEHALSSAPSESHLVHGILYAQAGLLDKGERELILIPESDSNYGLAQKLLKSIQEIRNSTR
jgi:hypothetical protein